MEEAFKLEKVEHKIDDDTAATILKTAALTAHMRIPPLIVEYRNMMEEVRAILDVALVADDEVEDDEEIRLALKEVFKVQPVSLSRILKVIKRMRPKFVKPSIPPYS